MQVPIEVTYRDVENSPDLQQIIEERVSRLERVCNRLISCRLAIERPQRHMRSGSPFNVRLLLRVPPGNEIIVHHLAGEGDMHEPLTSVLRHTFDRARLALLDQMEKERGDVKVHPEQAMQALVVRLFPDEDYGFLQTPEGEEYYFHRNSVLHDDFDRITLGTGVRFTPEMGEKGPQVSSLQIVNKPGVRRSDNPSAAG